jgi:hypothetical protein
MPNERAVPALYPRIAVAAVTLLLGVVGAALPAGAQSTNLTISSAPDHNVTTTGILHPTGPGANLNVTTLVNAIQAASGQTAVLTYAGFEGTPDNGEPGDIVISDPIAYTNAGGAELFIGSRGDTTVNRTITASGASFVTFAPLGSVNVEAGLSAGSGDIGFRFSARAQVMINGPITTSGIRGIDISAQSNDGTMGTVAIHQPMTITSGPGQISVFAEQGITVAAPLTVTEASITLFSDHAGIQVANTASFIATAPLTRTGPDGEQILFGAATDVTIGDVIQSGGPVLITTTDGLLLFRIGGDLHITKTTITAGAGLSATAGGNVTVDGQITAGGAATDTALVVAGKSFTLGATGTLQTANGASGTVVVDNLNPSRPNLSLTAQLTNNGTLGLGPSGMLYAVSPGLVHLGTFVPAHTRYNVWFGEPEAVVGINYKVSDPNSAPAIPTLSAVGLAALVSLLALASLWMLRRKRA